MNELDKIIRKEYETVSELEIINDDIENIDVDIKNLLIDRLSHDEYMKVEDEILQYTVRVEMSAFQQGFIRGIAIAKSDAL